MTETLPRALLVALAIASAIPAPALAQAAGATRPAVDPPLEALSALDRDALAEAEHLAAEAAQRIEQWIASQAVTEARVFARLYFPIPGTDPQKYTTPYDALADRDITGPEDKALERSAMWLYAILTDSNAYIPAHHSRFAQPLTGDMATDYINNRSKRLLGDPASLLAARSEARYLLQRTRLETGDAIYDLSVPVTVRGKHWGCVRIGYRRTGS